MNTSILSFIVLLLSSVPTLAANLTVPTLPANLTNPTLAPNLTVPTPAANLTVPAVVANLNVPALAANLTVPTVAANLTVPTVAANLTVPALAANHTVPTVAANGKWELLQSNIGISAMHMQLLNTDKVVIFDRTDFGLSNISLPNGKCRIDPNDSAVKVDCTAHSVEYDVLLNSVRPLMVQTDTWCSSGGVLPDGTLAQTGGYNDGDHAVRVYKPCADGSCDWHEIPDGLVQRRWYATNQILPDGRQIIIGGRKQPNYEFFPKVSGADKAYDLPFLKKTNNPIVENNLYPFVFLNGDGNLFIFANNRAILLNPDNGRVVRTYPEIPGGDRRNYPSTGSAVLLPLRSNAEAEVLVCGGAPKGAFFRAQNGTFDGALNTCGRIRINDRDPKWEMETMPMGRLMGDMVLLPDGNVLIINGCGSGIGGWYVNRDPVYSPVLYRPNNPRGSRFEVQNPSSRPRLYHSTAVLLRDGRVLVGGSNDNIRYKFTGVRFPTDLTLEAFSPSYLDPQFGHLRPKIVKPAPQPKMGYGRKVPIRFTIPRGSRFNLSSVMVTMIAPPFNTHSFSMNQRLLVLKGENLKRVGRSRYRMQVNTPGSSNLAPPGYYLLFVVYKGIPSEGLWVQLK